MGRADYHCNDMPFQRPHEKQRKGVGVLSQTHISRLCVSIVEIVRVYRDCRDVVLWKVCISNSCEALQFSVFAAVTSC